MKRICTWNAARALAAMFVSGGLSLASVPAAARNELLVIRPARANPGGLNEAVTNLERRFGFVDLRIAAAGSAHGLGETVRQFLSAPGEAGDLRVVWVVGAAAPDGDGSVCPAWNEDPVRPAVPSILVAPECLKYLVQAPSTYERASGPEEALLPVGQPGVVFVSLPVESGDDLIARLTAPVVTNTAAAADSKPSEASNADMPTPKSLVEALGCPADDKLTFDYSPGLSAWQIVEPLCASAQANADPAKPADAAPPADTAAVPPAAETPATETASADPAPTSPSAADAAAPDAPTNAASAASPPPAAPETVAASETAAAEPAAPAAAAEAAPQAAAPAAPAVAEAVPQAATPVAQAAPAAPAAQVAQVAQAAPAVASLMPSFASPVSGTVATDYGVRTAGKVNHGIDFDAKPGSAVTAAAPGQVVFVGDLAGYGKVVAIKHSNDWATVYAHTAGIKVTKGQTVAKGQSIAEVDPVTNRLHFEIRRRGQAVDPKPLLASADP